MHPCCLEVLKRSILVWMRGLKENRLSALLIAQINNKLKQLQFFILAVSAMYPGKLKSIDYFKMSENLYLKLCLSKMLCNVALRNRHFIICY